MDQGITSIEEIARAKAEYRRSRAALPFPEKIRILVAIQKRRAPIVKLRGKTQVVWDVKFAEDGKA